MIHTSTASNGTNILRAFSLIAVVLSGLLAGCSTLNFTPRPTVEGLPEAKKSPLHAGVYYSPEFASYAQMRKMGSNNALWHIGPASVAYFDELFPRVFEKTSRVETLTPDELAKKGVDLVVVPSVEHFDFPMGFESYSERFGVGYRTTLYTPRGVPVSSWIVYGTADHWKMVGGHVEAYMQGAGAMFLQTFERESAPGLAAIAASRQIAPQPIDAAALQLSARHTEPYSLTPEARQELRKEGFVFVELSATAKTARPLIVRASDMQLRLKDGRTIATYPPSSLLMVVARNSSYVPGPSILGLVTTLAAEAAISSDSAKRRELANDMFVREYFGERTLREGMETDGGVVFFRLPKGASVDGASVVAWALEPAAAAGSQVDTPLTGAPTQ